MEKKFKDRYNHFFKLILREIRKGKVKTMAFCPNGRLEPESSTLNQITNPLYCKFIYSYLAMEL